MEIIKEKTISFTGHRDLKDDFDKKLLEEKIIEYIKNGYDTFLCGMAVGFDLYIFEKLLKIKKDYKIKIVACIPYPKQSERFNKSDKEKYKKYLTLADESVVVSPNYDYFCMMRRNHFMVDNSSVLIAYYRKMKSGTYSTIKYAFDKGKKVEII